MIKYLKLCLDNIGAGPRKYEWIISRGFEAFELKFGNGKLWLLPYKKACRNQKFHLSSLSDYKILKLDKGFYLKGDQVFNANQ